VRLVKRNLAASSDEAVARLQLLFDGVAAGTAPGTILVDSIAGIARRRPSLLEHLRADWFRDIAKAPPRFPFKSARWELSPEYAGIERADLIVFNVHDASEVRRTIRALDELRRIYFDPEVSADVLGWRGAPRPVSTVAGSLVDPLDRGLKKALRRVRRTLAQRSVDDWR
jgi:hypothetical protein